MAKVPFVTKEQLDEIAKHVRPLYELRDKIFAKVSRELADKKIKRCQIEELEKEEKKKLKTYYEAMILPVLSPIVIGKQHPFPHIPNDLKEERKDLFWDHWTSKRCGAYDLSIRGRKKICTFRRHHFVFLR